MDKVWSVLELIQWTTGHFKAKGIESARREAEDLLGHVMDLDRLKLYLAFENAPTPSELALFRDLVARRAKGEPPQYLMGVTSFCGLKLKCDKRALIPRPETEALVALAEAVLKPLGEAGRFADLGTGGGCIALALLSRCEGSGIATDISAEALSLAAENAEALGLAGRLSFAQGDLGAALQGDFDLIVSNPPYIAEGEREGLQREVRDFEPALALFSGADGMRALKALIPQALEHLKPGGWLMLECGKGQPEALKTGLGSLWSEVSVAPDPFGIERFLLLRKA